MPRYIALRLLQAVAVLWAVSAASFLLLRLVPGDPARAALGTRASPEAVAALRRALGLDGSLLSQYRHYMSELLHGHLGHSITQAASVGALLAPRLVPSLLLVTYSAIVAVVISLPLALAAATRRNRPLDHLIRGLSTVTLGMPTFWFGVCLALVFGVWLGVLPTSGYGQGFAEHIRCLTLPAIAVGALVAPLFLRTLRSSAVQALDSDYVEACRARGLSERRIRYRHVLRNSLLPYITVIGVCAGWLLSWTVAAESVFAIPGLGSLLVSSVSQTDYPTVQALLLLFGLAVVSINLITDLFYGVFDPRVRL